MGSIPTVAIFEKIFIKKLNNLYINTKNKTLLEIVEYYYYNKRISEPKDEKKNDYNGIMLTKEFIKNLYYTY